MAILNFLNFASTGTFICLNTADTLVLAGSTFSKVAAVAATDRPSREARTMRWVVFILFFSCSFSVSKGKSVLRQHALEDAIAVDELVLQRRQHMGGHGGGHRHVQNIMNLF
ncbi:hypothetical protein D3C72_1408250 [compost metagenome]